jgi:hypothetical protein
MQPTSANPLVRRKRRGRGRRRRAPNSVNVFFAGHCKGEPVAAVCFVCFSGGWGSWGCHSRPSTHQPHCALCPVRPPVRLCNSFHDRPPPRAYQTPVPSRLPKPARTPAPSPTQPNQLTFARKPDCPGCGNWKQNKASVTTSHSTVSRLHNHSTASHSLCE